MKKIAGWFTVAAAVGLVGSAVQPPAAQAATTTATEAATNSAAQAATSATKPATNSAAPAATSATKAAATLPGSVAYVRGGDIYASRGTSEQRLTTGGSHARPRWSPNGQQIAFLKAGRLWTMKADGTAQRQLSTRAAAGASWSPDGKWLAFGSLSCSGGPGVYRISATAPAAKPEVLFPRDCRGEALPAETTVSARSGSASLNDRLRADDAVAWSPDGTRMAFRGGDCESVYDACLSIGTIASGAEKTVAAYGGGSVQNSGFAVVPTWRSDGAKLAFTAYQEGETAAESKPVHLVEYDTVTGAKRTIGGALDRELSYVDASRAVVTSQNAGGSWLTVVGLANGARTLFRSGSQPSVQPAAS